MAALPGDTVVLPHATNPQALNLQSSPSQLRRCGINYFHSGGDCGTTQQETDFLGDQSLTSNSHVAVGVPIEVETNRYDLDHGSGEVGVPLSEWKVKTSSMHCVSFHDLTYQVTQRKCCRRLPDKTILNSVSGLMLPGLNAIMGPTGSGKTTLLDILADRKDKSGLSGTVLIDGRRKPPNYKCAVGYVVQDDVVMGTLSVRENLHFSAALRLPSQTTHSERKERVEKVIDELGLRDCASTKVGTDFLRGISGGERKRTNIGMELIIEPQVLFLDEPTTGLDAYTAVSVVKLLKNLSGVNNRIVIMAIHQPRYSIFKLCDTLTLLSLGDLVYHGNAQNALSYFETIGFKCEEHENPADFFLDVINLCEKAAKDPKKRDDSKSQDEFQAVDLPESYRLSDQHSAIKKITEPILESLQESEKGKDVAYRLIDRQRSSVQYATSFFWQLEVVILRSVVNLIRSPATSILQLITLTLFALIIGGIYFQLDTDELGVANRIGVFFFIATNQSFGALSAISLFIQQRALFIHESASGYYRMSAFFIAKVLVDIVPLRLIPNTVFVLITYFMTGFQLAVDKFFIYFLVVNLTSLSASSVAFAISAGVTVPAVGNLLIAIIFVVSMLFGGLLIALESLPVWISWLKFLSFIRYAMEALSINEIGGLTFSCFADINDRCSFLQNSNNTAGGVMTSATNCTFDGLDRLSQLGYEVDWLWYDVIALVLYSTLFLTIAYLALLLIKKEK